MIIRQVEEKDLLGEVGQAYKYSIDLLNQGRVGIGAQMIGVAQASLDATIPYLFERKQFNQTLFSFQVSSHTENSQFQNLHNVSIYRYRLK